MDLMDLVAGRVEVLAWGEWSEGEVIVNFDKRFAPNITPEFKIAALARFLTRKESNPRLFDGDARHLALKSVLPEGLLRLCVGPLKYSEYNACRMEFAEAFGWAMEDLPVGMGMSVVVVTSDSKIVMQQRSAVVDSPGLTALPGGILDGDNLFEHVRKELREELGIESRAIEKLLLLGISRRLERNKPRSFYLGKIVIL